MEAMILNLLNGNLSDAKRQAKKFSWNKIYHYCWTRLEWSQTKSTCATYYLKTGKSFQAYCDAV